jgi:hypothetical protein
MDFVQASECVPTVRHKSREDPVCGRCLQTVRVTVH